MRPAIIHEAGNGERGRPARCSRRPRREPCGILANQCRSAANEPVGEGADWQRPGRARSPNQLYAVKLKADFRLQAQENHSHASPNRN